MDLDEIWDSIPEEDQRELNVILPRWEDELECMDNLRIARIGNKAQEETYFYRQAGGCCGFMDTIKMCSSARQYRIGCNYGH
jgi:hypothetical protein